MPDLDPRYAASIVQYTYVCMYVCMCFCRYYTWHWCPIREENSHRRHKQRMELMFVAAMLAETHVYLRSFSPLPDFHPTPNRAYQMSTNLDRSLIYRLSLSLSLSRPITLMIVSCQNITEEILYHRSTIRSRTNLFISSILFFFLLLLLFLIVEWLNFEIGEKLWIKRL